MAIIKRERNGKTTYVVMVRDPDATWYTAKTFHVKIEARNYEAELLALKRKGTRAKSKAIREYTLTDYWDKWSKEGRDEVSKGWKISQDQMWRDHIEPVLGKKKVIEIQASDIRSLLHRCTKKGLGAQMRIHIFSMLHKIFDDAIEIDNFEIPNPVKRKLKPEPPETVRDFYKPEEAFQFLEFVKDEHLGVPIWLMTILGLRIGEVQGLQRKSVDLDASTLTIERQWNRKSKEFTKPKNGRSITVPMPSILTTYLKNRVSNLSPDDFVAPGFSGGMLSYDTFEDGLKRLCRAAGLRELSPHELRHTCSVLWRSMGAGQDDIKNLFNHKNPNSTKPYMHESNERLANLAKTLFPTEENQVLH